MIQNRIACFDVAQQIDQRDLVGLRTRQRAHNEIEINRGKPRPTIRPDHRDFIMRGRRAYGKSTFLATGQHGFAQMDPTYKWFPDSAGGRFVVAHAVDRLNVGLL